MNIKDKKSYNPKKPWVVYYYYERGGYERGEIVSRHSTYELARKKAGNDSFLGVKDLREWYDELPQKPASNPRKRKTNPTPLLFIITAKGTGKKMHYDGTKFSNSGRVVTFKTAEAAAAKARELLAKYPILRRYRMAVEHNQHLPPKH